MRALAAECYGSAAEPPPWWAWWVFGRQNVESRVITARRAGRLIGMQPLTCVPFAFGDHALTGTVLTGLMVTPSERGRGHFRRLLEATAEEAWRCGAAFMLTMPNHRAYPAFMKLGWTDLGERAVWRVGRARVGSDGRAGHVNTVDAAAVASLATSTRLTTEVTALRDASWAGWRYTGNPLSDYLRLERRDDAGILRGLAVGAIHRVHHVPVGFIVDLIGASGDIAAVAVDMGRALRNRGARFVVAVTGGQAIAGALELSGSQRVPRWLLPKRFRTVVQVKHGLQVSLPKTIDGWRFTLAEWDGI